MAKDVFVSHSSKDSEVAQKICNLLEARGITCWIAPRDVTLGGRWAEKIINAIKSTRATVLVFSENANKSVHIANEIQLAVSSGKTIFSVRIRDVLPSGELQLFIAPTHWVDAWRPPIEQKVDQLADAIRSLKGDFVDSPPSPPPPPPKSKDKKKIFVVGALLLLALALVFGIVTWAVRHKKSAPPDNATSNIEMQQETTSEPSAPPVVMKNIKTKTIINKKDGSELILIPAGEFLMGSPKGEGGNAEHPQHKVYLDAYYIGKYEVTNEQFAKFVNETGAQIEGNYYKTGFEKHPVVYVTWNDALAYCKWANLRLPTEAEWEKAARGTDGRKYPWGNEWDASRCNNSVISFLSSGTKSVGSFPSGASPYGCLDMSGNVWEWCADWYDENYYRNSPRSNPEGPGSGSSRFLRGGSWSHVGASGGLRCASRGGGRPGGGGSGDGFRVVRPLNTR